MFLPSHAENQKEQEQGNHHTYDRRKGDRKIFFSSKGDLTMKQKPNTFPTDFSPEVLAQMLPTATPVLDHRKILLNRPIQMTAIQLKRGAILAQFLLPLHFFVPPVFKKNKQTHPQHPPIPPMVSCSHISL